MARSSQNAGKKSTKKGASKPPTAKSRPSKSARISDRETIKKETPKRLSWGSTGETVSGLKRHQEFLRKSIPVDLLEPQIMPKPAAIPQIQWDLPAGFKPDGSFATLGEVITPPVATLTMEHCSDVDNKTLVLERIKRQDYPTRHMLGYGEITKERALAEVNADTPVGKYIQETEQRLIEMLRNIALNKK
jgi:hypothetical protein